MIVRRVLALVAAIAAMAAAAGVCVVAAAYALYAFVRLYLEPAPAAAAIAAGFAALAAILAFVAFRKAQPESFRSRRRAGDQSLAERLIALAREKPLLAAATAVAAGLVIVRNPKVVAAAVSAAMASRARDAARRDRRR